MSGPVYVPAFDAFRGFAVLTIVVFHVIIKSEWEPPGQVAQAFLSAAPFALNVLFLVSGFVMFLPVAARGTLGGTRAFAVRRLARLLPAYYVCIAALLIFYPVLAPDPGPNAPPRDALAVLWHLLVLQNVVAFAYPPFFEGFGLNPAIWTLSIEVFFYAVLVLVAGWWFRRPFVGLAAAAAITLVWRLGLHPGDEFARSAISDPDAYHLWRQLPLFAVDFAAGMTGAWVLVRLRRARAAAEVRRWALPVFALGLIAWVVLLYAAGSDVSSPPDPLAIAASGFAWSAPLALALPLTFALFAVAADFVPPRVSWPLTNPVSRWLGDISYSVYLYHLPVVVLAINRLGVQSDGRLSSCLKLGAITLPASLLLGWLSLRFVERPARLWARRYTKRLGTPAVSRKPAPDVP